MKLKNVDREQLVPCANLWYANVLLAKLNARISMISGRPSGGSGTPGNNLAYKTGFFPTICCVGSVYVLAGWLL